LQNLPRSNLHDVGRFLQARHLVPSLANGSQTTMGRPSEMMRYSSTSYPDFLTTGRLAERWGKSVRTLQRWRAQRYGPAWLKVGATTFYRLEDVMQFERRQRITIESD
jgi:hypothetical protein